MSEGELKALITRESTKRLRAELAVAQHAMDAAAIAVLGRPQVVSHIFALRRLAAQSTVLKTEVPGFDPANTVWLTDVDSTITPTTGADSTTSMFFSMWQTMQDDNRRREEKEDSRREEAQKKEEAKEEARKEAEKLT